MLSDWYKVGKQTWDSKIINGGDSRMVISWMKEGEQGSWRYLYSQGRFWILQDL